MAQVQAPSVKLAGAETPAGNVNDAAIGLPVVGAEPMLDTVTGILLATLPFNGVAGWPIVILRSGAGPAITLALGVIVPVLLVVAVSLVVGAVPALNTGAVPIVEVFGVTGTLNALLAPFAIGPAVVQFTVLPVVVQAHPPFVKVVGAVTPVGKAIVVVIGVPVVAT